MVMYVWNRCLGYENLASIMLEVSAIHMNTNYEGEMDPEIHLKVEEFAFTVKCYNFL